MDIAPRPGQSNVPIVAAQAGTVVYRGVSGSLGSTPSAGGRGGGRGYGNLVIVYHGKDAGGQHIYSVYGHLSSFSVGLGDTVIQGQQLGVMGNTGGSYGTHLHYTIYRTRDGNKLPLPASGTGSLGFYERQVSISPTNPDPAAGANSREPFLEPAESPPGRGTGARGGPELSPLEEILYESLRSSAEAASQPPEWASQLINIVGSTVSGYLFKDKPLQQIVGSSLITTVGQNLAQAIQQGGLTADYSLRLGTTEYGIKYNVLSNFGSELVSAFRNAAIGSFSSFVALELGNALGLKGFGAELLSTGASTVLGQVLNNAVALAQGGQAAANIGSNLFHGLNSQGLFGNAADPTKIAQWNVGLLPSAIGSFLGAKLGSLILSPTNTQGALLSSIGSAAGAWAFGAGAASAGAIGSIGASIATAFGTLGNVVAPFVGSLVGFLLGSLIGRLFGRRKPRVPTAGAETYLDLNSGYWELGTVTSANNGNRQLASNMAQSARDSINGVIGGLVGGNDIANVSNTVSLTHKYGHTGSTLWMDEKSGGSWIRRYSGGDATAAVEAGTMIAIKGTKVAGGDIFLKRAIYNPRSTSLTSLYGNMLAAEDYKRYLENNSVVNEIISQNPQSAFAAGWFSTWAKIDELGLNKFQASDFFGGLKGFADSFGFDADSSVYADRFAYESLVLAFEGANLRVATNDGTQPFWLLTGTNNISDREVAAQSALIANFGYNVGYTVWTGQATSGNDIWVASGTPYGVTMDDLGYEEHWYWNHYDYSYEPYYVEVSGGDDIFVGTSHNDYLYGRSGYDWLDGGAGHDWIEGGEHDDVLIGRGDVDMLKGGYGNDYLSGGDGNEYEQSWWGGPAPAGLHGEGGNDTLVGGAGNDTVFGGDGDDIIIVDQDGGGTWDYMDGGAGRDTVSFERFNSGVSVDMNTGKDGWYTTLTYSDGWVSVENVTGSHSDDIIVADAQDNLLRGLMGNDALSGGDGNDVLEGGLGGDALDGGYGTDTASYRHSHEGVEASLSTGTALGADATGDTFASIENLTGSRYDDILQGDYNSNTLEGLKGNDRFLWSDGYDSILGGDGLDIFDASAANGALTVSWGYYASVNGWTSYLTSVEGFVGTAWNDSISGTSADEYYEGRGGNDYLAGSDGSDTYAFGAGDGWDSVEETSAGSNGIIVKSALNWRDVSVWGAGGYGSLTVYLRTTGEYMSVGSNWVYATDGTGNHNHKIKTLDLGGGSAVDIDMIDWAPYGAETDASTAVYGAQGKADLIFAYGGDDYIVAAGYAGAYEYRGNVIYAGDGYDTIYASAGDDQFIFERGNGSDYLSDSGGADTIIMGPSVGANDVIFEVVITGTDSYGGQTADLYVGIRDPNHPGLSASQVADKVRIADGGTIYYDLTYGTTSLNTIEYVRVAGQEIDLTKANINFATSYYQSYYYYDDPYYGGGGQIPPLAIDLDGDGIELRSVEGSRISTVDADGNLWRVGWVGPDDGFLARDRNGDGFIDRLTEISFTQDLKGAKSDLEGLAAYDTNKDGVLDAQDAGFGEFKVWRDLNQDGIGVGKELMSLAEAGIVSIGLKGQATGFSRADGIDSTVLATTTIGWADPKRQGLGYDVALAVRQVRSDGGGKDLAERSARAAGGEADPIDAALYGIQTLSASEVEAVKAKAKKPEGFLDAGMLGRVETFLPGSTKTADGLLNLAGAERIHAQNRATSQAATNGNGHDPFAKSAWTAAASAPRTSRDTRGDDIVVEAPKVSAAQQESLEKAKRHFEAQAKAAEARSAALAENERARAAEKRDIPLPSQAELDRRAKFDTFRLLGANGEPPAAPQGRPVEERPGGEAKVKMAAPSLDSGPLVGAPEQLTATASFAGPVEASERTASAEPQDLPSQPLTQHSPEADFYGVTIQMANSRLVQALGSFGGKAPMMTSYRGMNDVDELRQTSWLTVDRQVSVQSLVSVG